MAYYISKSVTVNNSGNNYKVGDELQINNLNLQNLKVEVTQLESTFIIEDINGVSYTVDDPDTFVDNNTYTILNSNPIYITADKSISIPRADVKKVTVKNVTFKLKANFLSYSFRNCTNLTNVIFDSVTIDRNEMMSGDNYFFGCFRGCTSLTSVLSIPSLPNDIANANYYFNGCFEECSSLTTSPEIPALPSGIINATDYLRETFYDCSSLVNISEIPALPNWVVNANSYLVFCFFNNAFTTAPTIPSLPSSVTSATYYLSHCFESCNSLINAPVIPALPSDITNANNYLSYCFHFCGSLTNALISNIPQFTGAGITALPSGCTTNYAGGTCPATPDTPITTLTGFQAGYNYH